MAYWNRQGELVGEKADHELHDKALAELNKRIERIRQRMDETGETYKVARSAVTTRMVREAVHTIELYMDGQHVPSHVCPHCKGACCRHCHMGRVPDHPWPGWLL